MLEIFKTYIYLLFTNILHGVVHEQLSGSTHYSGQA